MKFRKRKPPIIKIFTAMLMLFLSAASGSAQIKPSKAYSQTLAKHVRLMKQIINDAKDLIVTPNSRLWEKTSEARRTEITKDWLFRSGAALKRKKPF